MQPVNIYRWRKCNAVEVQLSIGEILVVRGEIRGKLKRIKSRSRSIDIQGISFYRTEWILPATKNIYKSLQTAINPYLPYFHENSV